MNFQRLSPRAALWSAASLAFALLLGVVLANYTRAQRLKTPPGAYLVAMDETTRVKVRWKTRRLIAPLTVTAKTTVAIPEGHKMLVVYPDGRHEIVVGPNRMQVPVSAVSEVGFLSAPVGELASQPLEDVHPTVEGTIHITSPVGVTRFTSPIISWIAGEGLTYDVAIVDPADEAAPPRLLRGVRPPVTTSALESKQGPHLRPDRIFGVLVRQANDSTVFGANRFLTAANADASELPSQPADLIAEAVAALAQKPARIGDAWLALSRLPAGWSESDLVTRLRLKVSAELGLNNEAEKLKNELKRLGS